MTNEPDSVRVALEALLLLLYAWNSCPTPGTNISCSLVAIGHEFAFPIDYSTNKHWALTTSPISMESYSRDLATRLSALCKVAHLLVQEHRRAYHCELINSRCQDPCTNSVGDIVFACCAVQSDASKGRDNKLTYPFTGPWQIIAALKGAPYKPKHFSTPNRKEKKHASHLSTYSIELVHCSHLMAQILSMAKYVNLSQPIHSRMLVSMGSFQLHHTRFPLSPSRLTMPPISTG